MRLLKRLVEKAKAVIKRLSRSEVQPTVITDKSGESGLGVKWGKKL